MYSVKVSISNKEPNFIKSKDYVREWNMHSRRSLKNCNSLSLSIQFFSSNATG